MKTAINPLPSGILFDDDTLSNKPIRSLIGSLLYIAEWTRPDIAASVNILSRHMQEQTNSVWRGAIQILRYLVTTSDECLALGKLSDV